MTETITTSRTNIARYEHVRINRVPVCNELEPMMVNILANDKPANAIMSVAT